MKSTLRDCGQDGVCRTPPGCARHWEERCRELAAEVKALREALAMRPYALGGWRMELAYDLQLGGLYATIWPEDAEWRWSLWHCVDAARIAHGLEATAELAAAACERAAEEVSQ